MLQSIDTRNKTVCIAVVGKYVKMRDAYLSVTESLHHGGYENGAVVDIRWVEAEECTAETAENVFGGFQGILIPGGFGARGVEGKITACRWARENHIPYLGICLGMQVAVVEYARHVLGWRDADSAEFNEHTAHPVIDLMPDQKGKEKGGTMRLGRYPCLLTPESKLAEIYGTGKIGERHRHRYEYNNTFREQLERAGLISVGTSPDGSLVEAVGLENHPYFIGVQYHPEFKSRPNKAHPLFRSFIAAALKQ
jgi:CTP synthase